MTRRREYSPVVVTPEDFPSRGDWTALVEHAGRNTRLLPGDILAAGSRRGGPHSAGDTVEVNLEEIGVLRNTVVARP